MFVSTKKTSDQQRYGRRKVTDMQDLCLEQQHSYMNDFGSQLEISAHSCFNKGQKSVCDMERTVRPLCGAVMSCLKHLAAMHHQQQQSTKLLLLSRTVQHCWTVSLLFWQGGNGLGGGCAFLHTCSQFFAATVNTLQYQIWMRTTTL